MVYISRNVSLLPANIDLEQSNCQHQEGIWWVPPIPQPHTAAGGVSVPLSHPPTFSPSHISTAWMSKHASATQPPPPATAPPWVSAHRDRGRGSLGWRGGPQHGPFPLPPVLEYVFDADTERRRLGHPPRVTFLGRQPSDPEHQFSQTVELPRQHARTCTTATFQLQVSARYPRSHLVPLILAIIPILSTSPLSHPYPCSHSYPVPILSPSPSCIPPHLCRTASVTNCAPSPSPLPMASRGLGHHGAVGVPPCLPCPLCSAHSNPAATAPR